MSYEEAKEKLVDLMMKNIPFIWQGMAYGILGTWTRLGDWQGLADKLNANCGMMCGVSAQTAEKLYKALQLSASLLPQPHQYNYKR